MGARLCLLSREFKTPAGTALVPLVDFANHSAANPAAQQSWCTDDELGDAMVVRAIRDIAAGEAVTICYGMFSNPQLLRSYGFCVPPSEEPTWTYACPVSDLQKICGELSSWMPAAAASALGEAFPELAEVHFEIQRLSPGLLTALDALEGAGAEAIPFLREFCLREMKRYETDPSLAAAMENVRAARASPSAVQ